MNETTEPTPEVPKKGIDAFLEAVHEKDEHGKSLSDYMKESTENFAKEADAFWDGLSYDDRLKAFHSVCKRIHKGDLVDRGSYRHVLYGVFGFAPDAYIVGMECGYLDIHNSIYMPDDIKKIEDGKATNGS